MSGLFIFFYFSAQKLNCFFGTFYFSAKKGKSFYGRPLVDALTASPLNPPLVLDWNWQPMKFSTLSMKQSHK